MFCFFFKSLKLVYIIFGINVCYWESGMCVLIVSLWIFGRIMRFVFNLYWWDILKRIRYVVFIFFIDYLVLKVWEILYLLWIIC